MPNEFEFSFSRKAMETLMVGDVTEIVVSGKVLYDQKSKTSTFEISARGVGTLESALSIKGCPTPC